jgi:hypothetical protein
MTEKQRTANIGLAKVGLYYESEHLYFLFAFVLNLNICTSNPPLRQGVL